MWILPLIAVAAAVAWAALVVTAQVLTPEQDALGMGMSGLVHGRGRVAMKAAFLARGVSALALVAALPAVVPRGGMTIAGLVLFWMWGAGSALLALYDTDMPGEAPSRQGAAHSITALVAYIAGVAGMLALSLVLRGEAATAGVARWALLVAVAATVALVAQFAGFAAAARVARRPAAGGEAGGAPSGAASGGAPTAQASTADSPPASGPAAGPAAGPAVPPQLAASAGKPAARSSRSSGSSRPSSLAGASRLEALAPYAGLLQRVFVALVMLWVVVVALGI